jgi:flagellar hook assembly protein FlgD
MPFVLSAAAEVELVIYDADGRMVRRLPLGYKAPGVYDSPAKAAHWDGTNDAGEAVSSGVYFYQMRVSDETFVRKALLLK